jgi:hypothetical protein
MNTGGKILLIANTTVDMALLHWLFLIVLFSMSQVDGCCRYWLKNEDTSTIPVQRV